ncbi:MAG: hypothetical protein K6B73_06875, partial [Treponema sp.]|nr:hypothetical protein [Treponema sp.]
AALALPTFAFSVKVGEEVNYLPCKTSKAKVSLVTKIAPSVNGTYELTLNDGKVECTFAVKEGEDLILYSKPDNSKTIITRALQIISVKNNVIEFEPAQAKGTDNSNAK